MTSSVVILIVVAVLALFLIGNYNRLVTLRNRFKNAFSQIDVQLKRRYDLIPNLVETAKAYMAHEKQTLEAVIAARNTAFQASQRVGGDASNAGAVKALAGAEGGLSQAMGRFMAVMESYPDLKAHSTMNTLMEELTSTENKVSFARQAYNDSVMIYNTAREVFPTAMFAGFLGFGPAAGFEIENAAERAPVQVKF
jgi:LemA protein